MTTDIFWLAAALAIYFAGIFLYGALLIINNEKKTGRVAASLFSAAFLCLTVSWILRFQKVGYPPLSNLYESLIFFSWTISLIFLFSDWKWHARRLGFFVSLANLCLIVSALSFEARIRPLPPALQSPWLFSHVAALFLAYGAFAVSFFAAVAYWMPLRSRVFSEDQLENWIYQLIRFGFSMLTLGIGLGAVWAYQAWGVYWNWDPKETWALTTWLIYAVYLHLRISKSHSRRKVIILSIFGFLCVMFTYLGVGLIMPGLHAYIN